MSRFTRRDFLRATGGFGATAGAGPAYAGTAAPRVPTNPPLPAAAGPVWSQEWNVPAEAT